MKRTSIVFSGNMLLLPLVVLGLTSMLGSSGCNKTATDVAGETVQNDLKKDAVKLASADINKFKDELVKAKGKVVLVDFWATWCGPCVEQFPHTIALHELGKEKGLAVITVSMDEPDNSQSVEEFLQSNNATCVNLITPYGASEDFANHFDLRGDVPFYKLYDRSGELRYTFSENPGGIANCEPITNIDKRVEELLAQPNP